MRRNPKRASSKPSKDPVIEAMETFMKETENVELKSVTVHQGKLYDTENLLYILGSKTGKTCVGCPTRPDKPKMRVLPKRRKTQDRREEIPPLKKGKFNKTTRKSAALRLQYAKEHTIPTIKCDTCHKIEYPKTRRATRIRYYKNHLSKLHVVDVRNDWKVIRNETVEVKQEVVVDLTILDGNSCYMLVNFAGQHEREEMSFEICEEMATIQYYKPTWEIVASNMASVTFPDVRDDLSLSVVDLTKLVDEQDRQLVSSEKECANAILPIIGNFHEMLQCMEEFGKPPDGSSFSDKSKVVGYQLVHTLSQMFVKNINMARFMDFVVSKMEEKYRVMLSPATVAYYLKMMFDENRLYCRNRLTQFLLREIDKYYVHMKSESVILIDEVHGVIALEEEVFTQDQLKQLADQIRQYNELFGHVVCIDVDEEYSDDYVFSWTAEKVEIN